jgi:hypothetical protein
MSQSSHINAARQVRPDAGARRTLVAVGSSALFGSDSRPGHRTMRVRPRFSPGMRSALPSLWA